MYCKNCGKKLPDDARFCDRCNASVRKQSDKMNLIGELKEERLARRKAKAVEERLKKIKKIKSRRRRLIFFAVLGIIMLGVISGVFMYINYAKNSTFSQPIENAPIVTDTSVPTEITAGANGGRNSDPTETAPPSVNKDGYIVSDIKGKAFAYPGKFALETENEDSAVYEDAAGDGQITVGSSVNSSDATATMKRYKTNVSETGARFGVDGSAYYITGISGSEIYHRSGYIQDGVETYYEFTYPQVSGKADEYEDNIDYMDSYLKRD